MRMTTECDFNLAILRLGVLQLAEELGNVSEACRESGMDRTSFYLWKDRFKRYGFEGLRNLPPVHKSYSRKISPDIEKLILNICLEQPGSGCIKIAEILKQKDIYVSSPTIQKILIQNDLGNKHQRWSLLEEKHLVGELSLDLEQVRKIEKNNPCFRERHCKVRRPGELLVQDVVIVENVGRIGRVYLHIVVDTFGCFAFGLPHTGKQYECAEAILHNDVLPFYRALNIQVEAVHSYYYSRRLLAVKDNYCEKYLNTNYFRHRGRANGFLENFKNTVKAEFFKERLRAGYASIDVLQKEFDEWLYYYNYERPQPGYPNLGKRPIETIEGYVISDQVERNPFDKYTQLSRLIRYRYSPNRFSSFNKESV